MIPLVKKMDGCVGEERLVCLIRGGEVGIRETVEREGDKTLPENRGFTVDGALIEMVVVREEYEVLWCGSGLGEKKHLEG